MGRVLTNNVSLRSAVETTPSTVPTTGWFLLEPNTINTYGAQITTVARDPISNLRQRRKGTTTDLESSVEFETDLILDHFIRYTEGFLFASYTDVDAFEGNDATATGFTVPSVTAAQAARIQSAGAFSLFVARGYTNAANNGLKVVNGAVAAAATEIPVAPALAGGASLVAETVGATQLTQLDLAGVRGADSDITINADGNIETTALDCTQLGLTPGQSLFIGGVDAANRFTNVANRGVVTIVSISQNIIVVQKAGGTLSAENGAGLSIDLFFGRFGRNVPVTDTAFIERTYSFELELPNLGNPSGDEYEYSVGNGCDSLAINLPLTDKATMTLGFVGTDTRVPSATREAGPSSALVPVQTAAFNTSSDIARLRIQELDETGITTCFKSVTLTLNNTISPEKCLGTLGAVFLNNGNFLVDLEAQILFTDSRVASAVRENRTVTFEFVIQNDDGAIHINIPAMTLGGGGKEFPINESVLINVEGEAFLDPVLQTSIGISLFPFLPTS